MTQPNDVDENPLIKLYAKLNLSIDSLSNKVDKQLRTEQQRLANLPNSITFSRLSQLQGSTDIQDFGGPQPGRLWSVRLLAAFQSPLTSYQTDLATRNIGAVPAAGSDPAPFTAVANSVLESVDLTLTTSATVANRQVTLIIDDGVNVVYRLNASAVQTASQTVEYTFAAGMQESPLRNGVLAHGLPTMTIGGGWRVRIVTTNLQAGDQWTAMTVAFRQQTGSGGAATVTWYVGQNMVGVANGQPPATMARWQFGLIPGFQNFSTDTIRVLPGERLLAGITNGGAGNGIALIATINDQPQYAGAPVTIE